MLQFRARVNLSAMARKGYSTFLKSLALLEPHHQIVVGFFYLGYQVGIVLSLVLYKKNNLRSPTQQQDDDPGWMWAKYDHEI